MRYDTHKRDHSSQRQSPKPIVLDYRKDSELFNETAQKWAEKIGAGKDGMQNAQIRKFYNKVLKLYEQSKSETFEAILPFVKMLNSKVAYASGRKSGGQKLVSKAFMEMMQSCIAQINTPKELENFKLFFEAVIGFHKALEGRK